MEISYVRADLATLKELLKLFGEVFEEPETYQSAPPSDEYLESLLRSDTFIPLAAVADGKVIGGLAAYVLRKFEQQRSEIYIYDLAVDENYRRRGVATGLINHLRGTARELGAWVIFVQADPGRRSGDQVVRIARHARGRAPLRYTSLNATDCFAKPLTFNR